MPEHSMEIGLKYNFDQSSLSNIESATKSVNEETEKLAKNFKAAEEAVRSYQKANKESSTTSSKMVQESKAYIDAEKRLYQSNLSTRQEYYEAIKKKATEAYNEILNLSKQGVSTESKEMQEKLAVWNNYNKARQDIEKEINNEIKKMSQDKVKQDKENVKVALNLAKQQAQEEKEIEREKAQEEQRIEKENAQKQKEIEQQKIQAEKQFAQERLANEKQVTSQLQAQEKERSEASKRAISDQVSYNQKQLNSLISNYKSLNNQVINMANTTKSSLSGKMFDSLLSYGVVQQVTNAFMQLGQAIVDVNYNAINNQRLMGSMSTQLRDNLISSASEIAKSTGIQITDAQQIQGAWIRINDEYAHSADLLNSITGLTAKFMNVGEISDAEQAVALLNASLLQFGVSASDAASKSEEFLNKWAYMADITAMGTADEYGEAIASYGASLKNLGGDMDDAIAQASVLADKLAMNGSEAGNALKTFDVYLARDKTLGLFEDIADELGDTSYKLTDNNGKLKEYRDLLGTVAKAYKHYKDAGNDVMANSVLDAIGATRRRDVALAMLNSVNDGSYDEYVKKSKGTDSNYLETQNEALMKTLKNQWNGLIVSMQQAGVELGNAGILEGLTALISGAEDVFTAFNKLPQPVKQFASSLLMVGTAVAGVSKLNEITGIGQKISTIFNTGTAGSKKYAASIAEVTQEFVRSSQNSLQSVSAVEKHTQAYSNAQKATMEYVENLSNLDEAYTNGRISAQTYVEQTKSLTTSYQEEMTSIREDAQAQLKLAEARLESARASQELAVSNQQVAQQYLENVMGTEQEASARLQLKQADAEVARANAQVVASENQVKSAQKGVEAASRLEANAIKEAKNAKQQYETVDRQSTITGKLSLTTLKQKMAILLGVTGAEKMSKQEIQQLTISEILNAAATKVATGAFNMLKATLGMIFDPLTLITLGLTLVANAFSTSKNKVDEYSSTLEDLQSELDETNDKIQELQDIENNGGLNDDQSAQLKAMQDKKAILEEQIKLTETLKANEEFLNHQGGFLGIGGEDSGLEKAKDAVSTFEEMTKKVEGAKKTYENWSRTVESSETKKGEAYQRNTRYLEEAASNLSKFSEKQLSAANEVVKQYDELQKLTGQGAYKDDGAILSGDALEQAKNQLAAMGNETKGVYSQARALVASWAQEHNVSVESATQAIEEYNNELENTKSAVSALKSASSGLEDALKIQNEKGVLTMEQTYDLMEKMGDKAPMLAGALEECEGGYKLNAKAQEILNQLLGDGNEEMKDAIEQMMGGVDAALDNADATSTNTDKIKENTDALDENNKKVKENVEKLSELQQAVVDAGGEPITVDVDTSKIETCQSGIDTIKQKIQEVQNNNDISPEVKEAQIANLNQQLDYAAQKMIELQQPKFMSLNVDDVDTNVQAALTKIQEYQKAVNDLEKLKLTGGDTTEAQKKVDDLATQLKNLPKEQKVAVGLQGKDEVDVSIDEIKKRVTDDTLNFPLKADTKEANKAVDDLNNNIKNIKSTDAHVTVVVNGINDVKLLRDALDDVKKKYSNLDLNVNAKITGESNVKTLESSISNVKSKNVDVGAKVSGLTNLNSLIASINKLISKTVQAKADVKGENNVKSLHKAMNNLTNRLVNAIANVSGLLNVIALKNAVDNLHSKTINVTAHVSGNAKANGNANANGMANASGNWGAKQSGVSLVGELGRELVVRGNSWFTVGDNGAQFIPIRKGDIVFNHVQTKEILEHGYVTSNGGRGRALAQGNAFLNGVAYSSGSGSKYSSSYKITDDYNVANTKAVQRYAKEAERLIAQAVAAGESISDSLREAAQKAEEAAKNVESYTSKYISNVESLQKRSADALKEHYQLEYDERKKLLEKEHNAKIDAIDEEIARLKGDTVEDKEKQLADLQSQLNRWKNDNSSLGKKKQKELQDQINDLDKEIKIDKLEKQRDDENDRYDNSIDKDSDTYDSVLKDLDNKMTDENLYKTVNDLIRKNDTDTLTKLLTEHDSQWDGWKTIQGQTAGQIIQGEVKDAINNYKDVIGGYIDENGGIYTRGGSPKITVDGGGSSASSGGNIGVGTQINAGSAPIYAYAGSTSGMGQYFSSDPVYTVIGEQGDYVLARWHKLSSGATGWFKKSEVTAMKTGGYTGDNEGMALLHAKERVLNAQQTKAFESLVYDIIPKIPTKFMSTGSTIDNNTTTNNNTTFNKELVKVEVGTVVNNTPYDIQNSEDNMDRLFRRSLRKSGITMKK